MKPYIQLTIGITPTQGEPPVIRGDLVFKNEGKTHTCLVMPDWNGVDREKISQTVEMFQKVAKDLGCRCKMDKFVKACYKDERDGKEGYPSYYKVWWNQYIDEIGEKQQEEQNRA